MTAKPDVTVVIAAWNAEAFIGTAIESALAQEGPAVEVIVSDDASGDGTAHLVQSLAENDPRLRLVANPINQGPSAARNRAIAAARGTWIAVLDADDRFATDRLSRLMEFAEAHDADLAFDLVREVDEEGSEFPVPSAPVTTSAERWDLARWIMDNLPGRSGLGTGYLKPLIRRTALDTYTLSYREDLRNSEDYALVADLLAQGGSVWVSPEAGYLYTRRAGSISHRIGPEHLAPLLRFEEQFAESLADAKQHVLALQKKRIAALKSTLTLTHVIAGLKARNPIRVIRAMAARPQAAGQMVRWLGEVIVKRMRP